MLEALSVVISVISWPLRNRLVFFHLLVYILRGVFQGIKNREVTQNEVFGSKYSGQLSPGSLSFDDWTKGQ